MNDQLKIQARAYHQEADFVKPKQNLEQIRKENYAPSSEDIVLFCLNIVKGNIKSSHTKRKILKRSSCFPSPIRMKRAGLKYNRQKELARGQLSLRRTADQKSENSLKNWIWELTSFREGQEGGKQTELVILKILSLSLTPLKAAGKSPSLSQQRHIDSHYT